MPAVTAQASGRSVWYMSTGIVAESDLTGSLKSEYVFFDGERVARKDFPGNAVSYYFSDHLKTASVITDSAGNIMEDEDYYFWGGELQIVNNDSNHYKFAGKERDSETGLDYFGARYYGNWLGRWMSPDWAAKPEAVPYSDLSDPQSLNLYSYVRNIPTIATDLDGHTVMPSVIVTPQSWGVPIFLLWIKIPNRSLLRFRGQIAPALMNKKRIRKRKTRNNQQARKKNPCSGRRGPR